MLVISSAFCILIMIYFSPLKSFILGFLEINDDDDGDDNVILLLMK